MKLKLPLWYDLHAHFRQGEMVKPLLQDHLAMGCAGILAMPNTKPPVGKVIKSDPLTYDSIENYLEFLKKESGDKFSDIIVPLYLTRETTPDMIKQGAKSGILRACKYYPPHGTTGAQDGAPLDLYMENGVFAAMQEEGIVLCIHGEEHDVRPEDYFSRIQNAEEVFYRTRMPKLIKKFPKLKIVCEHITTKVAADFVRKTSKNVAATITPQHLLYTVGHLLKGLNYHLYCLPLVKFSEDREALRKAVTRKNNKKFFAGTDSAPHTKKVTPCGCAAGCYTGGIAPQLYAQGFEEAGIDLSGREGVEIFKQFLCTNGPAFYGLKVPEATFILEKKPQTVKPLKIGNETIIPLPNGVQGDDKQTTIPWSVSR